MKIKYLKEKWVVEWKETWEIEKEKYQIQLSNWCNSKEKADNFIKILKEGKPIRNYEMK